MAGFSERRNTIRIAVNGTINVESVPAGQPLRLMDVGTGGFCVESVAPLPRDSVTSYRFATHDKAWSAMFRARAVYSKPVPSNDPGPLKYVSGFSFVNTEAPAVQRELMALMDHATALSFS
jgi:hypothetical protein